MCDYVCTVHADMEEIPLIKPRVEADNEEERTGLFSVLPGRSTDHPHILDMDTPTQPSSNHEPPKSKGFKPLIEVVSTMDEPAEDQSSSGQEERTSQMLNGDHSSGSIEFKPLIEAVRSEAGDGRWADSVRSGGSVGRSEHMLVEEIEDTGEVVCVVQWNLQIKNTWGQCCIVSNKVDGITLMVVYAYKMILVSFPPAPTGLVVSMPTCTCM